jgi:hypothetical protein
MFPKASDAVLNHDSMTELEESKEQRYAMTYFAAGKVYVSKE